MIRTQEGLSNSWENCNGALILKFIPRASEREEVLNEPNGVSPLKSGEFSYFIAKLRVEKCGNTFSF